MDTRTEYPRDAYEELDPLCDRGHVRLVRSRADGQLYVKKYLRGGAPEVYRQILAQPVPGMPALYGVYPEPEGLTVIEEYIPGRTLAEILAEEGPLPERQVISIGLALCAILRDLHSRKSAIIHRDIKPGNIIRQPDGTIVLLDLSAAKTENPWQSRDTVLIGTAGYAAPEQYGFSASTPQTDLYAMGVLLNVLRTGAMPWERPAQGRLRRVIGRCLKLEPRDRYLDARELETALKRAGRWKAEWLPPGFRSLKWYCMIPAVLFYGCWLQLYLLLAFHSLWVEESGLWVQLALGTLFWAPVAFYGDYLDFQRLFPLMRSGSRVTRLAGRVLFLLWLGLAAMGCLVMDTLIT